MFLGSKCYDYPALKKKYQHLDVLPNAIFDLKNVKVVLGQDNYHLLFPDEYRKGRKHEPWAVKTKLGWSEWSITLHEVAIILLLQATWCLKMMINLALN